MDIQCVIDHRMETKAIFHTIIAVSYPADPWHGGNHTAHAPAQGAAMNCATIA